MGNKIQCINAISYLWYPACRAVCLCLSAGASVTCVLIYFVLLLSAQLDKGLGKDSLACSFPSFCSQQRQRRDARRRSVHHDIKECLTPMNLSIHVSSRFLIVSPAGDKTWRNIPGWNQPSVPFTFKPQSDHSSAYVYLLLDLLV